MVTSSKSSVHQKDDLELYLLDYRNVPITGLQVISITTHADQRIKI